MIFFRRIIPGVSLLFFLCLFSCRVNKPNATTPLRIGSCGDYPPLTTYDTTTLTFQGADIDLARELGKHLGRPVTFIKTTWPALQSDLLAGKFDIAIGGISITAARQQKCLFSDPLITDRKVALFRRRDSARYTHFAQMDIPGVTIIENKGGTNQQFAQAHIRQATLQIITENQQIFPLLLAGKADVMFTDETEALYQQTLHPDFFVKQLPDSISPVFYKAIMLRKTDEKLQQTINKWLRQR
ncbi:transporter substrate-binding domain-containing protein [Chitinophaga nivalis]|uniref:Transporter substrate-binding domain-containing protein n=1 Tax=Chitinophaga nivalis TaxID=2991709 RepID=A0ABT3IMV6_9BACT|nr:transporter substrate-binding domain-containing protein [Chitinophaga nivalis]MCW3465026.1 transporter substrate-binding domain-containing protein [Chitinophaga nivalis]MCW3485282.1 transporter substrate-binding domain-containing protein [Chitinophaga nivalis]